MSELPLEGHIPDQVARSLVVGGGFLISFGLVSCSLKNSPVLLGEPLLATISGSILGPFAINLLSFLPKDWDAGEEATVEFHEILIWIVRVVISIGVLFAAATCPQQYPISKGTPVSLIVMMLPVMIVAWWVSAGLVKLALPALPFEFACLIGSTLAPTDPVLAGSIVKGVFAERYVPTHIRQLLSAESAINDGFGTPFVFMVLHFIKNRGDIGQTAVDVLLRTVLWNVVVGTLLGIAIGTVMRYALIFVRRRKLMDEEAMLVFTLMMVFIMVGIANMLTTNELLAACFAGFALNWSDELTTHDLYTHFSEGVEMLNDTYIFLLIGVLLPWDKWAFEPLHFGSLVLLGITVMLFRRIPGVLLLYKFVPNIENLSQALLVGHFGPIGVGALFYALLATEELPEDFVGRDMVIPVIMFIVLTSVVVHGISAPLIFVGRKLLGMKEPDAKEEEGPEASHVTAYELNLADAKDKKEEEEEDNTKMESGKNAPAGNSSKSSPPKKSDRRPRSSMFGPASEEPMMALPPSTHRMSKRISSMGNFNQYGATGRAGGEAGGDREAPTGLPYNCV